MDRPMLTFDRRFQVWLYTVSHGQLLLRSVKDSSHHTQVDVLFKNVAAMSLPTQFQGLLVIDSGADSRAALTLGLGELGKEGRKLFRLSGDGWEGGVIAGIVVSSEGDADYYDESRLIAR